jgi:hypothetical protein
MRTPLIPFLALCLGCAAARAAAPASTRPGDLPRNADEAVWQVLRPAMLKFQDGLGRDEFLRICTELQSAHPGTRYETELTSLIRAMTREKDAGPPAYVTKKPEDRTPEETARYWVYQLRDVDGRQWSDPGYPNLFVAAPGKTLATDELVRLGTAAIGPLVDALEDDTPTRTIAWQRSFYPVYFVLRRQDLAVKCLERITGIQFYEEGATYLHLYLDTPARRNSVIANIRAWWAQSKGKSQAQMIRNQMALARDNLTLHRGLDPALPPMILVDLEGPEGIIETWEKQVDTLTGDHRDYLMERISAVDKRFAYRLALRRLAEGRAGGLDFFRLLDHGDKAVYQDLAARWTAAGKIDVLPYGAGEVAQRAAAHGKNWALPILALALRETKMTGSRFMTGMTQSRTFSHADEAVVEFQKLTGKDFGYNPDTDEPARLAAIARARDWWESEGHSTFAARIAEDHALTPDPADLHWTDEQLAAAVKALADPAARPKLLADLRNAYSPPLRRALLNALADEPDPAVRRRVLEILAVQPQTWYLPTLTQVLKADPDAANRRLAAATILHCGIGQVRLETADTAAAVARQVAAASPADPELIVLCEKIIRRQQNLPDPPR